MWKRSLFLNRKKVFQSSEMEMKHEKKSIRRYATIYLKFQNQFTHFTHSDKEMISASRNVYNFNHFFQFELSFYE